LVGFETSTGKNISFSSKGGDTGAFYQHKEHIREVAIQQDENVYTFVDHQRDVFINRIMSQKTNPIRSEFKIVVRMLRTLVVK